MEPHECYIMIIVRKMLIFVKEAKSVDNDQNHFILPFDVFIRVYI